MGRLSRREARRGPRPPIVAGPVRSRDAIAAWLAARVAEPLGIRPDEVDLRAPLAGFGIGSLRAVRLAADLEAWLGRKLSPTLVYDYPTIDALAAFPRGRSRPRAPAASEPARRRSSAASRSRSSASAAGSPAHAVPRPSGGCCGTAWRRSARSRTRVGTIGTSTGSTSRAAAGSWKRSTGSTPASSASRRVRRPISTRSSGCSSRSPGRRSRMAARSPTGWPARPSASSSASPPTITRSSRRARRARPVGHRVTGSSGSIAANRISHFFDFRGPSLAIDTACSSSLVAVHLACKSLWDGESGLAMAGGVNLILEPEVFASFAQTGFLSPGGRCKTFDAGADGYVRGEGAGIVVLKPMSRALADGDPIYAVIRGGAVNQDGRTNGLTAPSRQAQEAVLRAAYRHAGIAPGQVDYVEAHGTGTPLGDPIELTALGAVLGEGRDAGRRCTLGSVKTNIGHLEAAAGVAGLIKAALSLHHRAIPASLNFSRPNPHVDLDALPLRIPRGLEPWPDTEGPATAGVSSFGFGGTNAHVVLEEAPHRTHEAMRSHPRAGEDEDVVIPISGARSRRPGGPVPRGPRSVVRRIGRHGPPGRRLFGRRTPRASRTPPGARRRRARGGRRGPRRLPARRAARLDRDGTAAPRAPIGPRVRLLRRGIRASRRPRARRAASRPSGRGDRAVRSSRKHAPHPVRGPGRADLALGIGGDRAGRGRRRWQRRHRGRLCLRRARRWRTRTGSSPAVRAMARALRPGGCGTI